MFRTHVIRLAMLVGLGAFTAGCPSTQTTVVEPAPIQAPIQAEHHETSAATTRARLAEQRKLHIERLHAYRLAGVFPRNRVRPGLANIFRDEEGHLCAVANLIHQDGLTDLVDRMARENNFVLVAEETSGALHDWVLASGFTREEIAMIQKPYSREPLDAGAAWRAAERKRLMDALEEVERRLVEDSNVSLDVAIVRLQTEASARAAI